MENNKLYNEALKALELSYSPYSNFKVGAALLTNDDKIFYGANIENAAYGACMCAERNAIYNAYMHGYKKDNIKALAVIGNTEKPISPCGECRQVMSELLPTNCLILLFNTKGDVLETSLKELLPYSFTSSDF